MNIKFITQTDWKPDNTKKICHIRTDHDGYAWFATWWDGEAKDKATKEQLQEINEVHKTLRDMFSKGVQGIKDYLNEHPEAKISNDEGNIYYHSDKSDYWIRLITRQGDYNMYINCYVKKRLPLHEISFVKTTASFFIQISHFIPLLQSSKQ